MFNRETRKTISAIADAADGRGKGMSRGAKIALSVGLIFVCFMQSVAIFASSDLGTKGYVIMVCTWAVCLTIVMGMVFSKKWALRVFTFLVFLSSELYVVDMTVGFIYGNIPFAGQRTESTLLTSIIVMTLFGFPCLWYSIFGRGISKMFTKKPVIEKSEVENIPFN